MCPPWAETEVTAWAKADPQYGCIKTGSSKEENVNCVGTPT